jgi:hypothetical protein
VTIAAVMAPIALVYIRLQRDMGFTRDVGQLGGLSARLADYFRVAAGAWNWGGLLPDGGGERQLFHGFTVIVFAVVGASVAARDRTMPPAGDRLRTVTTYGLMALLAVWLSMGPGPWRPYLLLYNYVPGFNGMRVPSRLASIVVLALSVLAGGGFA